MTQKELSFTVGDTLRAVSQRLQNAGLDQPTLEAEFLIAAALGISRPQMALRRSRTLSLEEDQKLERWTNERAARVPLAYICGDQPFGDLTLSVTPDVLIPRPETEEWVARMLRFLNDAQNLVSMADVGTGSGNIALSLAQHPRVQQIYGIDVSREALAVARRNAVRYDPSERCQWICGSLLDPLPKDVRLDWIVANLPYIRSREIDRLSPEVRREPRLALDGGESGLELIFKLIGQAAERLAPGGRLWLEIGCDQALAVRGSLETSGGWSDVRVDRDLAGLPRVVQAVRGKI